MSQLESERMFFRHHEMADLEEFCAMESDSEFRHSQPVHTPAELERSFLHAWLPAKELGLLATAYKPEVRYIGRCGLYPRRDDDGRVVPGEAVLAYYLARPYWGRGLATEAGRAFIRYGFEVLGLSRSTAGMNVQNLASIRLAEKLGFVRVRGGEGGGNRWNEYELKSGTVVDETGATRDGR